MFIWLINDFRTIKWHSLLPGLWFPPFHSWNKNMNGCLYYLFVLYINKAQIRRFREKQQCVRVSILETTVCCSLLNFTMFVCIKFFFFFLLFCIMCFTVNWHNYSFCRGAFLSCRVHVRQFRYTTLSPKKTKCCVFDPLLSIMLYLRYFC